MGRYNLLDEDWLVVLRKDSGAVENVSLFKLFEHAPEYRSLAGEMETQNFAVLRVLLAILTTVFTRVDASGEAYEWLRLDGSEKLIVEEAVDEDDAEDYIDALSDTWEAIWKNHRFPAAVIQYLRAWHERFYLLDDDYPFFQATKTDLAERLPAGKRGTPVAGMQINRLISESGNKEALFAPVAGKGKSCMTEAELARWLIAMQGYMGTFDKRKFSQENQHKFSKGWLYDIGGIYMAGDDLFETLWMNTMLYHTEDDVRYTITPQSPCWEDEPSARLDAILEGKPMKNLAALYTAWSRAAHIAPDWIGGTEVSVEVVKLTEIAHENAFLEPMTLWEYNKKGEHKNKFTPEAHKPMQALWRSFGLLIPENGNAAAKRPGIMDYYHRIAHFLDNRMVRLHAVSMLSNGDAKSMMPVDEITDVLSLNEIILTDDESDGWSVRVRNIVAETKSVIEKGVYKKFLTEIAEKRFVKPERKNDIGEANKKRKAGKKRPIKVDLFVTVHQATLYEKIDIPFREWLRRIQPADDKAAKERLWKTELYQIALREAEQLMRHLSPRDYEGEKNCVTAYHAFKKQLKQQLLPSVD